MKSPDEKVIVLENALRAAHRRGPGQPVSTTWEKRVMSRIRMLEAAPLRSENAWEAPGIWRAAAAACTSAFIVLACSFAVNIGPEYEAARLLLEDPLGSALTQSLLP